MGAKRKSFRITQVYVSLEILQKHEEYGQTFTMASRVAIARTSAQDTTQGHCASTAFLAQATKSNPSTGSVLSASLSVRPPPGVDVNKIEASNPCNIDQFTGIHGDWWIDWYFQAWMKSLSVHSLFSSLEGGWFILRKKKEGRKKERKQDGSDVATGTNRGVASFSIWSKAICKPRNVHM